MQFGRGALLALLAFGQSGCATWVEGTRQYIAVTTPPVQSAYCVLTRLGDRWTMTTPGVVRLDKSIDDIAIRCSHPGYQDAAATIPSEPEGWTLGNVLFGGFPAAIDVADGAMSRYPDAFALPMTPVGSASVRPPPSPESGSPKPSLPGTLPDNF